MVQIKKFALIFAFVLTFCVTAQAKDVTLVGETIGIKLYTDGLVVTETQDVKTSDGKMVNIAEKFGIKKGDIIMKINNMPALTAKSVTNAMEENKDITLTIKRDGKTRDISLTPAQTPDGKRLGIWLRDSTAGLGTITFIDGDKFYALGHGICDIDTGDIMPVKNGIIQRCHNIRVIKGTKGTPGAITGQIDGDILGNIATNSHSGITGNAEGLTGSKKLPVAEMSDIMRGDATILCNIDGSGTQEYKIKIKRISIPQRDGKDMVIEVTDERLLEKTGGIVQGMSGAPIIQNGKLVGAVTHVFVNDPTRGYGIFIENMLDEANKIK